MRSIIYIILAFSMINIVLSDTLCVLKTPSSKKDCTDYELTDKDKGDSEADTCCYVTYKDDGKDKKMCLPAIKKEVTKDNVKDMETEMKVTDLSVDCHSNWLSFSFLFLLFSLLS